MNELVKKIKPEYPSLLRSSLFDDFFGDLGLTDPFFEKGGTPCDIAEIKDDNGVVIANEFSYALAGYEKSNVGIEIDDNRLTIKVDKTDDITDEDENKNYLHKGMTRKSMSWSYVLNNKVDADNVNANMDNGVLKVRVPLLPVKEVKKIEVK